jgi:hypothetical protein
MNIDIIDSDDDGPPELVESGIDNLAISQQEEAASARKVPITIVTGTNNKRPIAASITSLQTTI